MKQLGIVVGAKLMEAAENEAGKRGCTIAYANTFPWQTQEFYEKLGFKLYGKLEDLPEDHRLVISVKS